MTQSVAMTCVEKTALATAAIERVIAINVGYRCQRGCNYSLIDINVGQHYIYTYVTDCIYQHKTRQRTEEGEGDDFLSNARSQNEKITVRYETATKILLIWQN